MSCRARRVSSALSLLSSLAIASVHASGFRIPEASVLGLSTSNAVVANPAERGALAYNPAAMSFHDGVNVVAGLVAADPTNEVTTLAGTKASDVDTPFYIPNIVLMGHASPAVSLGLNITSPFGLETNWPNETFPGFAGPIDGLEPSRSKLQMANVNPNVAFKLGTNASIAVGVDYYWIKDVRLDTQAIKLSGNGDGVGVNFAFMHTAGDWSTGFSWRSRVTTDIDGSVSAGGLAAPTNTEITFPAMIQVGMRNQATQALALEFDIEHTDWSSFNALVISHSHPGLASPIVSTNAWDDALAFRFGGTLELSGATQLRFGYTRDKTGQEDTHFSARIPDADRHLLSVGIGQDIGNWQIEAGYMYVRWDDRTVDSAVPFGAFGGDANGTNAYNGAYKSTAHLFGLGVNGRF